MVLTVIEADIIAALQVTETETSNATSIESPAGLTLETIGAGVSTGAIDDDALLREFQIDTIPQHNGRSLWPFHGIHCGRRRAGGTVSVWQPVSVARFDWLPE